jgi:two-component system copper resistance phosphate regulon response regulator CusR
MNPSKIRLIFALITPRDRPFVLEYRGGAGSVERGQVSGAIAVAGRILVVEDDASLARSMVNGLSDEGFVVMHAGDGNAAREALRAKDWDLVILDWWLPGQDGLAVLHGHRREGGSTPVLFVTARDAVSDRVRGLDGGADDYLCKPFAFEELLARARAHIRRGRPVEVTTLSFRDVCVDLAAQKAERAGHPLDLTAKELAVLVFFFRHPGQVLSRTRIYGHVWGEEYDFVSNTLDVHINALRRALEARGARLIHTVRGRGYLLGDPPPVAGEEDR